MKPYSFLDESTTKVWRKIYSLPKDKQKSVAGRWLMQKTKTNNLDDAATEYGKMIRNGSIKKIQNIANRHNRSVSFVDAPSTGNSGVIINRNPLDIVVLPNKDSKVTKKLGWFYNKKLGIKNKDVSKSIRELNRPGLNNELNSGLISAHESDEYEQAMKLADKLGISPHILWGQIKKRSSMSTGIHYPGVLSKEQDRFRMLGTIFDRGTFQVTPRTKKELSLNRIRK